MPHFAVIDIGSNALRLAIGEKTSHSTLEIRERLRKPLRLGTSVFSQKKPKNLGGSIEKNTYKELKKVLLLFQKHIAHYRPICTRVVATSAFREAQNRKNIQKKLYEELKLWVNIISGKEEAELVSLAVREKLKKQKNLQKNPFLIADIGGGSVELICIQKDKILKTKSFPLGTVRLLQMNEKKFSNEQIQDWLPKHTKDQLDHYFSKIPPCSLCVGTGGNMDQFLKLQTHLGIEGEESLTLNQVVSLKEKLQSMGYKKRVEHFDLKPDRGDVIVPAIIMTQILMEQAGSQRLHLPLVGLKDGVLQKLIIDHSSL